MFSKLIHSICHCFSGFCLYLQMLIEAFAFLLLLPGQATSLEKGNHFTHDLNILSDVLQ